jgi:outer membrane protein TolC
MNIAHQCSARVPCRRAVPGDPRLVGARRFSLRITVLRGLLLAIGCLLGVGLPIGGDSAPGAQISPSMRNAAAINPASAAVAARDARDTTGVGALVDAALAVNPTIRASRQRLEAARARITPAGLMPDPMLMAGVQDFPVSEPGFNDFMTMKMIGVGQTIPYPGKLGLRRRVAERLAIAAEAALVVATLDITAAVRTAYYELAFLDRALEIVDRNQRVLGDFIRITEARYVVGTAGQQDVLRARVEATRLAESAVTLVEQRRATLARLNAMLDRPSETQILEPRVPQRVARAAVADSAGAIRFVSAALGARASGSPLPPLIDLQETAVRESPALREHEAMIGAQAARVELARKAFLPDFDVSLSYGQRTGFTDMVSAIVSVPIPLQKGRKQEAYVAGERADLAGLEAEHHAQVNELRAEVARLYSEAERQRAQLALYVKAIIPQGRAALASATSSYQVGRTEFLTVLDNQATLFNYETEYFRALTDFAKTLAELERLVGKEVLR